MATTKTGKILISKPFGGWINTLSDVITSTNPTAALEGNEGQYTYSVAVSLTKPERLGHLSPGETFTALTDSSTYLLAVPINGALCSNSNAFIVLQNGSVIETGAQSVGVPNVGIIDSFSPVGHGTGSTTYSIAASLNPDVIVIKDNASTPNEYVVATWDDGVGTTIASSDAMVLKLNGANITLKTSDWFSQGNSGSYLIAAVPHKMCQGPQGNVYITNGQYIASATMGASVSLGASTRTAKALNLGSGWISNGICSYKNYLAIVGHNKQATFNSGNKLFRGDCRVWLWDGTNSNPNFIYDIPDNYGNGIYFDGVDLYVVSNGRNNSSKIFKFNGNGFSLIVESGFIAPGFNPNQGGMEFFNESLHIGAINNSNAHLFQLIGNGLHDRTIVKNGTTAMTSVGMVKNFYQNALYVGVSEGALSNGIGTSPYRIMFMPATGGSGYYLNSFFRTRLYDIGYEATLTKIKVYFSQFGTGASLKMALYKDYDTGVVGGANDLLNKTINYGLLSPSAAGGVVRSWSMPLDIPKVNSFYLDFIWNHASTSNTAAIIRKVEVEYLPTDSI